MKRMGFDVYKLLYKVYDLLDVLFFRVKGINPRKIIEEKIEQMNPNTIADMCCGTMTNSLQIAMKHPKCKVLGIDLSKDMLRIARKKANDSKLNNVYLKYADATQTGIKNNSIDVVIIGLVLHECNPELRNLIMVEAYRILKEDGRLIILEWESSKNILRKIKFAPMYLLEKIVTKTFPEFYFADKKTCFEKNGFKTNDIVHCNYSVVLELQKI